MTLVASPLQRTGPGAGGEVVETERSYDASAGRVVYVVADRVGGDPNGALTGAPLPMDDEEIRAVVPLSYGSKWPFGLENGASLPGATLQRKRVSRRSNTHAWVICSFSNARWGAGPYQSKNISATTVEVVYPMRYFWFGDGNSTVWGNQSPPLTVQRAIDILYVRIPYGTLSAGELESIKNNIGKRYAVGGVLVTGGISPPTMIGSVDRILVGYSYQRNDLFSLGVLVYKFWSNGYVPGKTGTLGDGGSSSFGQYISIPELQSLEEWIPNDAVTPPVVTVQPKEHYPSGDPLPGFNP